MPVQRDADNGGWQHIIRTTTTPTKKNSPLRIDKNDNDDNNNTTISTVDPLIIRPTTNNNNETTSHPHNNKSNMNDWAYEEGLRRIRKDVVERQMQYLTGMAAIGGFLFGYDTGVISGAMLPLRRQFELTSFQQEVVVSSTVLSAFVFSILGGSMNQAYGRRKCICMAATVFCIGSIQLMMAWNYTCLIVGRVILGFGIGIASLTTPVYIAEVAMPNRRGQLVTINGFMVTFGQFIAGMVDGLFAVWLPDTGWRYMLGLAAVPACIMMYGFYVHLPESPRWLVMNGHFDQALVVLKTVRETDDEAVAEWEEIQASVKVTTAKQQSLKSKTSEITDDLVQSNDNKNDNDNNNNNNNNNTSLEYGSSSLAPTHDIMHLEIHRRQNESQQQQQQLSVMTRFLHMVSDVPTRRALILGCGLMMIQQFSGVNTVMYYAASIYEMSEFDEVTAIWLSGFTALAQVTGVGISIYLVDRIGRRTLVLWSLTFVTLSLIGLGCSFYCARITSEPVLRALGTKCQQLDHSFVWDGITKYCYDCVAIDGCGFCGGMCIEGNGQGPNDIDLCPSGDNTTWTYSGGCQNQYGWLSVFFMVSYLLAFGFGMGGLPWTINSEIYALQHRSLATSCSTATNWISNLVVAASFLSISSPTSLTAYGAFWMYAAVALLGWIWLYLCLPETKGLHLEEIQRLFESSAIMIHQNSTTAVGNVQGYDAVDSAEDEEEEEDDHNGHLETSLHAFTRKEQHHQQSPPSGSTYKNTI